MDFHGMKRKDLQTLCKKHGIPANLKNIEMANRLSSLLKNENVKEAKKVTFSPDTEIFEFTRSVKKRCVTRCSQGPVRESGVEVRRSQRNVGKGKAVVDYSSESEVDEIDDKVGLEKKKVVGRRSTMLVTNVVGDGSLIPAKRSKRIVEISSEEDEPTKAQGRRKSMRLKGKTMEDFKDCEVQTNEKVLDVSNVEKVTRRSRRLGNNVNVVVEKRSLVDENVKAGKCDDLEIRKAPKQSKQLGKSVTEPLDVDNVKKLDVDDEMQVRVRFTRNSSRHGSYKDPIVIEETVVKKKKEEALVESTKRVTRSMKRDRSVEPGIGMEPTSTQRNVTPVKLLDDFTQFEQEKAGNATEEARGSSKKSKKMNQACVKDTAQEMIENSSSSSKTKAAEYVMSAENVLDSLVEKSADIHQRTNTQEFNSELMGGTCEGKLGRDTVLMAATEKENEEVLSCSMHLTEPLSPASALLAVSNSKAELYVSSGHIFASPVIVEESTKTKDNSLIFSPRPEHKEHNSTAKSANAEVMENSGECSEKINSSKVAEKGSSEKDVQAANIREIFSECNTENSSAKEEMENSKVGCTSVGHLGNLTSEKLLDEYAQLEPEEEDGANIEARGSSMKMKTVNQELANDNPRGMAEDSPSISGTKSTESVVNSENVLDFTLQVSGGILSVRDTEGSNSELMVGNRDTVRMTETEMDKEEASSQSVYLTERSEVKTCPDNCSVGSYLSVERTLPPASLQLSVSDHEAELGIVSDHIFVKDIASTVITEGDVKTKEEALVRTPVTGLKEHSSVANIANEEVISGESAECCKEVHSSKDDQNGSLEKDLEAANSHGNFFENYNENSSAEEGMEMSKVGSMSVGHCVYLTQEKLLDAYIQLDPEEAGGFNVEAGDSSMKMKTLNQKCIQDEAQGNVEDAPFTSESKASEPMLISENVLDSTSKCSDHISLARNAQELNAELMEEEQEQDTILMTVTKNDEEEASSLSVSLIEPSEVSNPKAELFVETTSPPAAVQLAVSCPEAEQCVATEIQGNFSEYNTENSGEIEQEEISKVGYVNLETLDEVKNDSISSERGCKLNVELSGWLSTDFSSVSPMEEDTAEDKTKALSHSLARNKDGGAVPESAIFTTPERSLLLLEQLSENGKMRATDTVDDSMIGKAAEFHDESAVANNPDRLPFADSSMKMKTPNQECIQDKAQGMVEDAPFSSETKATEPMMISENVLDSTPKCSGHISPLRNAQEWNAELMEEREEKQEQDTILMTVTKNDKEEASSLSVPLIERSEVGNPKAELLVETTPPPAAIQLAVRSPEAELCMATEHNLLKDIASIVIPQEDIKTKEEIHQCELKEHNSVSKLAEVEAVLENSAECWNEIQSSKNDEKSSLEKDIQGNFSEYSAENSSDNKREETLDEVKDDSLEKFEKRISSESGCKLNVELSDWLSTDFSSVSPMEEDKTKALSQPLARNEDDGAVQSAIFTTPERSLLLMEQLSENGKARVDSVTRHNDEALESPAVVFTTPEQLLLLENSELDKAGKEEEHTTIDFPDESDTVNSTVRHSLLGGFTQNNARNDGDTLVDNMNAKAPEFHNEPAVSSIPENSEQDEAAKSEENKAVELGVDSGIFSGAMKHLQLERDEEMKNATSGVLTTSESQSFMGDFESGEAENKNVESLGESNFFTDLEKHLLSDDSGLNKTGKIKDNSATTCEESFGFTSPEKQLLLGNSEQQSVETQERKEVELKDGSASFSRIGVGKSDLSQSHQAPSTKVNLMDDSVVQGNRVASLDSKENTVGAISSITSKVYYSHEFNAGQETPCAVIVSKGSYAEEVGGLDATEGTFKGSRSCSPLVDSVVNLFNLDTEGEETIMGAEMSTSLSSYVLALPTEGYLETISETSSHLEVAETCSMVSEESGFSTGIQNQTNDAMVELAKTADEFKEEGSVKKNIQSDNRGNLMLDSSGGGSFVSGGTMVLAGTEEEHLGSNSGVVSGESGDKFLDDKAISPIVTASVSIPTEKATSLTSDDNMNEKEKIAAESHDESVELDEAAKGGESKTVELGVDSGIFSATSDVLTASESQPFMRDLESGEAVNKNVESLGESNIFTDLEKHLLSDDSGLNETGKIKNDSAATCEESFVFTSPEKRLLLGNSEQRSAETQERKEVELKDGSASFSRIGVGKSDLCQSYHASSPKVNLMDDNVIHGSRVASLDSRENTIAASGSIASKLSHSREFNVGQETLGEDSITKDAQAEGVVGLYATQGTLKGSRGDSPIVDSVNLSNVDIEEEETIMEAEMNTYLNSYVLALPTEGYFEEICQTSSRLEVAETCSMVSEQSGSPTGIQNQISNALVELEKTEENEADELIEETSVTKNIQRDSHFILDSSGGCSFVLAGTENEQLGSISEVVSEESGGKILEDKAIATPFVSIPTENAIAPYTIQNSKNGKAAHDMKENARNSKILDNLHVTALRTSKRKPLQDLKKMN